MADERDEHAEADQQRHGRRGRIRRADDRRKAD